MKRVFLVMFVSALLVTLGFTQTPDAGSNTPPASVKGCLGGSDGNYTVVEDGTGQIFKITSSTVDLKPHVGHDVKLVGHKADGAVSSGAADNSFSVNELSMISEHCGAAAAASAAAVTPSPETVIAPDPAAAAAPATPAAPAVDAAAPGRDGQPGSGHSHYATCGRGPGCGSRLARACGQHTGGGSRSACPDGESSGCSCKPRQPWRLPAPSDPQLMLENSQRKRLSLPPHPMRQSARPRTR